MITHLTDWRAERLRHGDEYGDVSCGWCGCPLHVGDSVLVDHNNADIVCGRGCRARLDMTKNEGGAS